VALVGAGLASLGVAATVAPASADTFTVQPVPGTQQLNAVACATATTCLAVGVSGSSGVVVPITNGVPGTPQAVSATNTLMGVACYGPTTCVAVGSFVQANRTSNAVVVPITIANGSVVVGAVQTIPNVEGLNSVACYSTTSCVAVGTSSFQGVVVPVTNGVAGAAQFIADDDGGLTGVACYGPSACVAVGNNFPLFESDGVVVSISDGTAGAAQLVTTTSTLNGVACRLSICEATGALQNPPQAGVVEIIAGVPGTPQVAPGSVNGLLGVACPTDTLCEAVGNAPEGDFGTGVVVPVNSGVPGDPLAVSGASGLNGIACPTATTCIAVGQNSDMVGVVVTLTIVTTARPTISTQASPGNLLGAPVSDTATLSGGTNPTGSITFSLFSDAGCATQVFTSTNNLSGASATSGTFTPATAGTYYWTAAYSGDAANEAATSACGAANESVVIAPFTAPTPTRTVTGDFTGPLTVNAGESVLITNARVVGPVTVNPGGALTVVNSQVSRGIVANAPSFFSVCGSQVAAPSTAPSQGIVVSAAAVPIRIGDPAAGCAANRVAGDVSLTGNTAGLTLGSNIVSGNVTVDNNTVGTDIVKANTIFRALACAGNTPAPTNAGQTNSAGSKSGQCSGL
jgi:hypothetical protein